MYISVRKNSLSAKWALNIFTSMLFACSPAAVSAINNQYDALIIEARKGNTQPALTWFSENTDLNNNQIADWLQISAWSGQDHQVVEIYNRYRNHHLPVRGYAAVAIAYRNLQQWQKSLALWQKVVSQEPQNKDYRRGQILTLADAGKYDEALNKLQQLKREYPDNANLLAEAYIYKLSGRHQDELLAITESLPASASPVRYSPEYVQALRNNQLSAVIDDTHLTPDVRADIHAELVRLSFMPTRSENERYDISDRALALYAELEAQWKNNPDVIQQYQRIQIDHLGALLTRDRYKEAIAHYQRIKHSVDVIPPWAQYWVASAYLRDHQPEKAQAMMTALFYHQDQLVAGLSEEESADLFYSHLESENYSSALTVTQHTLNTTPAYRRIMGSPLAIPNDKWLQSYSFLSAISQYGNDLPHAEALTHDLASKAPGNQGLRIDYASVLQARGLPRAAETELKKAEVLEPGNITLEVEQAWTALTLQEWQQAKVLTEDVVTRKPQDPAVQRLQRAVDVHDLAELRVAGSVGLDSDGPDNGNHDVNLTSVVYSPPINENWRGFAGFGFADGQFSEGKGIVRDWLTGVEWRSRDLWWEAEFSGRYFNHETKPGARLSGWYDFNDNWRIGTEFERISHRVPLRAMKNGITGNSAQAYLRWYQNERRQYTGGWAFTDFSDGNERNEAFISGQERVWSSPNLIVDFQPSIWYGQNTKKDTPYYNPEKTLDIVPAFEVNHLLWRNYENSWQQTFSAGVGTSWQKNYGTDLITQVGYGQRVAWNDVIDAGATLRWEKRPYDGDREHNLYVEFDMTFKF
ncbi:poly-beta-1,6 N-acetyl-D-glucosamine export porin PgaA [Citrobacter sp. Awk 4]|uniref:poly-beta-1,6 N-acetyl-D-glucosamine export porin PgaA n=1 Tax=Citrobacter sp. Awk 4 TaxID=2963955 RepID=UPI0023031F66|nr:poly-beta-1,6 N-acetyl-D-glucosamine export porin PgaA [Citrobacter sp. Awk 4]MDA8477709.1 poly-beta-1,6 N-acetyl-D-glucosamine export porin PgaA [Citrobacter sp. Awk 4]